MELNEGNRNKMNKKLIDKIVHENGFSIFIGLSCLLATISFVNEKRSEFPVEGTVVDTSTTNWGSTFLEADDFSTFNVLFRVEGLGDTLYKISRTGYRDEIDMDDIYRRNFHPGSKIYAIIKKGKLKEDGLNGKFYRYYEVNGKAWSVPAKEWKKAYERYQQRYHRSGK